MAATATLVRHPDSPDPGVDSVQVDWRCDERHLHLSYRLHAAMEALLLPPPVERRRGEQLWEHTCFELFAAAGPAYREFNFAPSGAWAVHDFRDYREPAEPLPDDPGAVLRLDYRPLQLFVDVQLPLAALPEGTRRLGLAAVIESQQGERGYWALAHPAARPDFHHPDSFLLDWPA